MNKYIPLLIGATLIAAKAHADEKNNNSLDDMIEKEYKRLHSNKVAKNDMLRGIKRLSKFEKAFQTFSKKYNVDPELAKALAINETAGIHWYWCKKGATKKENPGGDLCRGPNGALGMFQIMPFNIEHLKKFGIDAHTPEGNIQGGIRHLSRILYGKIGNIHLSITDLKKK